MVSGMEYQPWQQPNRLSVFLGKITRNLAFDKYKYYTREKRGIAEDFAMSENNARIVLLRIRSKLKQYLEKEGIVL